MKTQTSELKQTKTNILEIVVTALFIALVYVFTAFINVQLPIGGKGGLIHLGNIPLFVGAIIFGKKVGCIAGGVGMALFDLLSPWAIWAPFTLVIVGSMGYTVGLIAEKVEKRKPLKAGVPTLWYGLAIGIACVIKIVGYYFAEVILYHNFITPFASIPGNVLQVLSAGIVTLMIAEQLKKAAKKTGIIS